MLWMGEGVGMDCICTWPLLGVDMRHGALCNCEIIIKITATVKYETFACSNGMNVFHEGALVAATNVAMTEMRK